MFCDISIEEKIVTMLESYVKCPVILANQTSPEPKYPYISYTIITPVHAENGTYNFKDGVYYQPMLQTWSFTVQSDKYKECQKISMMMYDFFARAGRAELYKSGISVSDKSNLTSRDNYITIQYEYRCGIDITFRMMQKLDVTEGKIESSNLKYYMKQKGSC